MPIVFNSTDLEVIEYATVKRRNVYLQGSGGTGKSYLMAEITKRLRERGVKVAITATTGAAAVNVGGTTVHRFAGIGLGMDEKFRLLKRVRSKKPYIERWKETDVLIIDEISMMGGSLFDKIEYVGRNVRNPKSQKPFAGMQIIVSGDMLQLSPIHDCWVFESECWDRIEFKTFNLIESKRYEDRDHFSMLLRVREAEHTSNDLELLRSRYDEYHRIKDFAAWEIKPTIIYSYKVDVAKYNEDELGHIPGKPTIFKSIDEFVFKHGDGTKDQKEYYKKVLSDGIPEIIALKDGAQVILKKNIDVEAGLINGSRGVIIKINPVSRVVTVKFCNGVLSPIGIEMWEIDDDDAIVCRNQIPLILGWASTVHSLQGSTLDLAVCDIGQSIFAPGQAYVAMSRVRTIEGLFLSEFDPKVIKVDAKARKFVRSINNASVSETEGDTEADPKSKSHSHIEFEEEE